MKPGPSGSRFFSLAAVFLSMGAVAGACQDASDGVSGWFDGRVCYEIFVRSFIDSDGDGIGDLNGLIKKLDYVNDGDPDTRNDLGAGCIWLMPLMPSPTYHGYDITDYYRVAPQYGTNAEFRRLVDEAHERGIRILVDLVINHVSSEHPFFQEALRDPTSPYREWFHWAESPGPPNEWGGNNWHPSPLREEYYYGFFWRTMPDLDWETPAVREEMLKIASFWLNEMGADGLRLDAVRHLMEEPGRAANVHRTHDMLREFAARLDEVDPEAFTIGEVFDSTDVLLDYYPDQLDNYFAFEVADGILDAVRSGSGRGLKASLLRLQSEVPDHRWAPFLRNHDQSRTMTLLQGDMDRAKLAATLLLTLPGLPFVYYGEEIGMTGDKPDPRIRTPMHWTLDPAAGFTEGTPWEALQPDSFTANVEVMEADPNSLLNLYRDLIHMRAENQALGSGRLAALETDADEVMAYLRQGEGQTALVVANLGAESVPHVSLSSTEPILESGSHHLEVLLGGTPPTPAPTLLEVGPDGRLGDYVPLPSLQPLTAYVFTIAGGR